MAKVAAESVKEEKLGAKWSSRPRTLAQWKEELLQKYTLVVGEALTSAAEAIEDVFGDWKR
jgi:hypothetical protein